jgi:antitoxin CcdA
MLKASVPQALKIVAKVFRCVEARLAVMSTLDHVARNVGQVVSGFARHEALLQPNRTLALFIYSDPFSQAVDTSERARKPANLSLDNTLLQEAKALGINVSRAAEAGISEAVKRHKRQKWLEENAAALKSSNAYVDAHGLPLAQHRQF